MAVEILESCMVAPSEAAPKHGVWLSNLDLLVARGHTPTVYIYRPSSGPASFSPDVLKAALSNPLAGRRAHDGAGRPEISCSGEGVLFVTARADSTLDVLGDFAPSDELRRTLVPSADASGVAGILAMFQVGEVASGPLDAVAEKVTGATARLDDEYVRSLLDHLELQAADASGLRKGEWVMPETDLWVASGPLDAVAEKVTGATARLDDEYVRSLLDHLELQAADASGLRKGEWVMPETDLWVISWQGLPIYGADFGWGRPAFMGRACLQFSGLVYLVPGPDDDGRLDVVVAMEPESLARFREVFYQELMHY
uniref:Anthranilate N-benzoyltransferase protein 1 n=1 Tax=Aegilops tauschii TaxID=37682 RepID=M8B9D0_AEGTA